MSKIIQQMRDTVSAMNETIAQLTSTQAAVPSALPGTPPMNNEFYTIGGVAIGADPRVGTLHAAQTVPAKRPTKYQGSFSGVPEQIREDARDTIPVSAYDKIAEQFDARTQGYAPSPLPCMCCAEKGRQHVSSADRLPDEVAPSDTLVKTLREAIFRTEDSFSGEDGWEALARRLLLALAHYEADSEVF